jgi:predicted phosphodiesterase
MKEALIATVKKHASDLSGILVPGDLTSIASPAEFEGSVRVVKEIASALTVKEQNIFFTFGNHDVDWRISSLSGSDGNDELYNKVAASTGGLFASNHPSDVGPVPGSGVFVRETYTLFAINSGYYCHKQQNHPHGKLGASQLCWLAQMLEKHADGKLRVVMVHHHPFKYPFGTVIEDISCLEEGAELVDLMGRHGVHIVCHGHRHEPKIFTETKTGWQHPVTFLCAGSVAVNENQRNRGEIPNLFHLLIVEREFESGAASGRVVSFQYRSATGWEAVQYNRSTPIDHIQSFGMIACKHEQDRIAAQVINDAIGAVNNGGGSALLPALNTLPPELQCLFVHELNDLFKNVAQGIGGNLFGKYPDRVLIKI